MPLPKNIKYIVIHCSAGFGDVASVKRFWKQQLGWKNPGYHRFIDEDGTIHKLANYAEVTNGVRGFNNQCIHICYKGGVNEQNVNEALDTRTLAQKNMIKHCISDVIMWLRKHKINVSKNLNVVGHRDFSPDKDGSGVIEPWERIKECPSFDAIDEYVNYASENQKYKLPK